MQKNTIIAIVVIILLAVGAYYFLGRKSAAPAPAPAEQSAQVPESTQPAPKEFTLNIVGKKLVSGVELLSVKKGDTVLIHITNDADEEFHLHGYDKHIDLEAGKQGDLQFVADTAGRFPAELEGSKTDIITLEVLP